MLMTLRLTTAGTEALRETARREHQSMHEVARTAIDGYVIRRTTHRDEHLAAIVREDADLLCRLRREKIAKPTRKPMIVAHKTYATPLARALNHEPMNTNQLAQTRKPGPVDRRLITTLGAASATL